jgi:hypothetical protein
MKQKRNHRQLVRSRHFFPSSKEEKIYKCQFVAMIVCVCVCVFSFSAIIIPHHTSHLFSRCNMGPFAQNASDLSFPPLTFSLDLLPWD